MISIPAFGEENVKISVENKSSRVAFINKAVTDDFEKYRKLLSISGYKEMEYRKLDSHSFAAFRGNDKAYFLNLYENIGELYIVEETDSLYFDHENATDDVVCTPQITQIDLEDFGMSYAVRLSDGRFIIFDGGRDFAPDADKLFDCLKKGSKGKKPRIAAWIMTHPHTDHFHCFVGFMDTYGDAVDIDAFYFNFPEHDDVETFPALAVTGKNFDYDTSGVVYIPKMYDAIKKTAAKIYTPHTGQTYVIGDAVCEILSSMDDTIDHSSDINPTSLVIRMQLGGQVILWAADASFSSCKLAKKHGEHLKADILQVPHHGFGCGLATGEIEAYDLIRPETCFIPVAPYHGYTVFSAHKEGTRYLMRNLGVKEIIMGIPRRTITLPYTPPIYAEKEIERNYLSGMDNCGAPTWFFTDLSTACPEDFNFTFLNTTVKDATVDIDIYFEDAALDVSRIKAVIGRKCIKTISIIGDEVDSEWRFYNPSSLKKMGIPEDVPFAVRFMSDVPIVVSNKNRRASYHAINR